MSEGQRLFKYTATWTFVGVIAGLVLYFIFDYALGFKLDLLQTLLISGGYSGYFIGFIGGFYYLCRNL